MTKKLDLKHSVYACTFCPGICFAFECKCLNSQIYKAKVMKRITLIILAVVVILTGNVSCQKANDIDNNPLSEVALSIIPDFSDGSVYSCSDEGSFFLRVSVKPEKYIEKLSDNDAIICKADFRSVITKANEENPDFTVVGEITSSWLYDDLFRTCRR